VSSEDLVTVFKPDFFREFQKTLLVHPMGQLLPLLYKFLLPTAAVPAVNKLEMAQID
jgi:hypothetical protein